MPLFRTFLTLLVILLIPVFISPGFAGDTPTNVHEKALPQGARSWEKIIGLNGLSNVGRVSQGIYRGAQPAPEGYATLKRIGIKTVINLRTSLSEKDAVEAAGMKSIEAPLNTLKDVAADTIDNIIEIIKQRDKHPVFVHCRHGQDRTGIIIAAYRIKVEGWSIEEAEAEMQDYGFNDIWINLKESLRKYAKERAGR